MIKTIVPVLLILLCSMASPAWAESELATTFTYQGRLNDGAQPASGSYDLTFTLFDSATGGVAVAGPLSVSALAVTNGLFTATLNPGAVFDGSPRWVEIAVRTNGNGDFTTLNPRQPLTPSPYAITAANLSGQLPASQLIGTLPLAQMPDAILTNGASGVNLTGTFTGDGAGLTNVAGISNGSVSALVVQSGMILPRIFTNYVPPYDANNNSLDSGLAWYENQSTNGGGRLGFIRCYQHMGGNPANPTDAILLMGGHVLRFECGWDSARNTGGRITLGAEDMPCYIEVNYLDPSLYGAGSGATNLQMAGYNFVFRAKGYDTNGVAYESIPGIQAWSVANSAVGATIGPGTNLDLNENGHAPGELWFYRRVPSYDCSSSNVPYPMASARIGGKMLTDGWDLRGRLFLERQQAWASDHVALNLQYYSQDFLAKATSISITTTNWEANPTNIERHVYLVRSGILSVNNIAYPALWNTNGAPLPPSLSPSTLLRLELESTGMGESNINLISAMVLSDNSGVGTLDSDVQSYVSSTGPLEPGVKSALNAFVLGLKRNGLWDLELAIYPFATTNNSQNAINLRNPSQNTIAWYGSITSSARGVSSDGTVGTYGDTGIVPSTALGLTSTRVFSYVDVPPPCGMYVFGCADADWSNRLYLYGNNDTSWEVAVNGGSTVCAPTTSIYGGAMVQRDASGCYFAHATDPWLTVGQEPTGLPATSIWLLDCDALGASNGPGVQTLSGFSVGQALTAGQYTTYYNLWQTLQTGLGRAR